MTTKLEKLKQQQERIRKQIRLEEKRLARQRRNEDTRRKILAGALIIAYAEDNPEIQALLNRIMSEKLTRDDDRALFGLQPLSDEQKKENEK